MANKALFGILILFFTITGCAGSISSSPGASADDHFQKKIRQFINNGLEFEVGHSRKKVIQNLGKPLTITVEKADNPDAADSQLSKKDNNADADEIYELSYDGLTVTIFRAVLEGDELLQHIAVTDSKYKVKWGLDVGCARNTVLSVLGNPSVDDEYTYIYAPQNKTDSYVQFYFKDDVVYKIDWWYYFD